MLSVLLILALGALASGEECFGGGIFGSFGAVPKCYHFVSSPQPYEEASAICGNLDGTLVSVTNVFEEAFIISNVRDKLAIHDYWIGLTDLMDGVTWIWDDQSVYNYTNWLTGEPSSDPSKNCVAGRLNTGKWYTLDCTESRTFICQSQPLDFPSQNVPVSHCPSFTDEGLSFGKCYLGIVSEQTYEDAELICENFEGLLVSIADTSELQTVIAVAKHSLAKRNYWIGLDRLFNGIDWEWSDGDTYDAKNFTDWATGFPTNKSGDDCAMALSVNSKWQNKDCTTQLTFICEVKPTVVPALGTPSPGAPTCPATTNSPDSVTFDRNWTYFAKTNSLYYVIGFAKFNGDWFQEYEAKCVAMGGHLPSIHSSEEYGFVAGFGGTTAFAVAIGYHSTTDIYSFEWSDGTPDNYTVWNSSPTAANLCAYIYRLYNGFCAYPCNAANNFIFVCKKPYA